METSAVLRALPARPTIRRMDPEANTGIPPKAVVAAPGPGALLAATAELLDRALDLIESAAHLSQQIARIDGGGGGGARSQARGHADGVRQATFQRSPDFWLLSYEGVTIQLRHGRGLDFIAHLLRRPGERVHALDLIAQPTGGGSTEQSVTVAYRQRIDELRSILDEASAHNDWGRAERARESIEVISEELLRVIGYGAGRRRAGSAGERARINVTRAIGASLRRITSDHRPLGHYFQETIRTGTFCSYSPDPRAALDWTL